MKWAAKALGRIAHPRKQTIFGKVLVGYLALTLLVVTMTGLVNYFLVREHLIQANKAELLKRAQTAADMIARPGGKMRILNIERLSDLQNLSGAQFIYVDTNMVARQVPTRPRYPSVVAEDEEFDTTAIIDSLDQALVSSLLAGVSAADVRKLEFVDADIVFAGAPIIDVDGNITGALILYRPLTDVQAVIVNIVGIALYAAAFAVCFAVALAWVMSRRLTKPLRLLNDTAHHMAEGRYGERIALRQSDEIGQLGATFNLLSGRLSEVISTLRDEKLKLQQILMSIGEGIVAIDREGHVVHHNAAALQLLGLPAWHMLAKDEPSDHQLQLIRMLLAAMENRARSQAGWKRDDVVIEVIVAPIISPEGEAIGAVGLLRDVSEASRLEQMRRDYIANISHELRTPLTGIRGMVEPLLDGYIDTEQEKIDCYTVIYQETLRLEKLIGEMLDLSRLQEGRITMELEPMEPDGLLEAAARRLRDRAEKAEIALKIEADPPHMCVLGNENRIMQVLIILLDNALSFTPSGGTITLFARQKGDQAALGVADTGAGIEAQDLPYIWERFYKADKSRMRTSGTGLGLAIAKLVVELMHGEIGVETEVGVGSTFTFTLDRARQ